MLERPVATVAATAPLALDAAALGRLRELDPSGKRGVVRLILSAYETSLRRARTELSAQVGDADPKILFLIAHTLKSSSASVGALDLSAVCAEIEAALQPPRGGAPESSRAGAALDGQIARLDAEADAALGLVRTMLDG
ncbi:MAG: Hpt domain-containing protein [Rubrivivax sp.]